MEQPVSVFDFIDYRIFLKEFINRAKQHDRKYSQRYFAQKLGVKSTGFFAEVLGGKRNLSGKNIIALVKVLGFDAEEADYFGNSVNGMVTAWSTEDYRTWEVEKEVTAIKKPGRVFEFNHSLYCYDFSTTGKSYRSDNGADWEELTVNQNALSADSSSGASSQVYTFPDILFSKIQ